MRRRPRGWLAVALLAGWLPLACAETSSGPPAVVWGVDECDHCHMILGEQRFAAVARDPAGAEARFDDLGCLVAFLGDRPTERWDSWVHAGSGGGWLPAGDAWYAHSADTMTPMGSGLTAHATRQAAAVAGAPLGWEELLTAPPAPPRGGSDAT